MAAAIRRHPAVRKVAGIVRRALVRGWRRVRRTSAAVGRRVRSSWLSMTRPVREWQEVRTWERRGRPAPPPPRVKQGIVAEYARRHHSELFVETGTYRGDMVEAQRRRFRRVWSIELQPRLAQQATARFARDRTVSILQGDSAVLLPDILASVREPCLFWLDAHYSAGVTARGAVDTPIVSELETILRHPVEGHIVLIDDAREFTGKNDYPTIEALRERVADVRPDWVVEVRDDVIRAHRPL